MRPATVMDRGVGELIRQWRRFRGKSQLALALDADVSARHVSFIESGRSRPSRRMVQRLADALDIPLRDRNALLTAAGFAAPYRETALDAPELTQVQRALDAILSKHEPHPAVVMDRHWNVVAANRGAATLFGRFVTLDAIPPPVNVLRLMFDPDGVRPFVENWDSVADSLLARATREAVCGAPDERLRDLLEELREMRGDSPRPSAPAIGASPPIIPVRFRKGNFSASYFSTVTTLGTPQDVTLQEIRIECFFPADDQETD